MSQENVEIVRRAYEAFNQRDLKELAELSHEDLEFISVIAAVDAGGAAYRGSQTWTSYFAAMDQTWEEWRAEDFEAFDAGGDRVAAVFRLTGKGKHSGAAVERKDRPRLPDQGWATVANALLPGPGRSPRSRRA